MAQIIGKIVRSKYPPKDTNVLWLDAKNDLLKAFTSSGWTKVSANTEINALRNAGYLFAGIATIDTNPEIPDAKIFYIANGKGKYTNFSNINVTEDNVVILYYDNTWHKISTGIASQEKLSELDEQINGVPPIPPIHIDDDFSGHYLIKVLDTPMSLAANVPLYIKLTNRNGMGSTLSLMFYNGDSRFAIINLPNSNDDYETSYTPTSDNTLTRIVFFSDALTHLVIDVTLGNESASGLVDAINTNATHIGNLAELGTTHKDNLVDAINEVKTNSIDADYRTIKQIVLGGGQMVYFDDDFSGNYISKSIATITLSANVVFSIKITDKKEVSQGLALMLYNGDTRFAILNMPNNQDNITLTYTPTEQVTITRVVMFSTYMSHFTAKVELGNSIGLKDYPKDKLQGKKVSFTGDSICYGHSYLGGYGKIIADRNNMVYQNIAQSGGTIVETSPRFCIGQSISLIDADADYVILEGGVNDAGVSNPIGQISFRFASELDLTTFAGAFENMLRTALLRFPTAKIGYILPHFMVNGFSWWNLQSQKYEIALNTDNYRDIAIRICRKFGIPYLDLTDKVPPLDTLRLTPEFTDYATQFTEDGWHPNELGYKTFYCDKIEAWMRTL